MSSISVDENNHIDIDQQALDALADAGLGNDSPAEAFVIGYRAGWDQALALAVEIEERINQGDES